MKYIVISSFKDLTDNEHVYSVGDEFPRAGKKIEEITEERLQELTTCGNKKGRELIKKLEVEENKDKKTKNNSKTGTTEKTETENSEQGTENSEQSIENSEQSTEKEN